MIWSEFNATYMNESNITDSIYMGPWMADTIRQCDGKVNVMSYWTFSDVFEEQGPVKTPFYGGYGLIAEDDIPKPAFNVFAMLHKLGDERIAEPEDDVLVTKRKNGSLVIAAWNLVEPDATGHRRHHACAEGRAAECLGNHLALGRPAWRHAGGVGQHGQAAVSHVPADRGVEEGFAARAARDREAQGQSAHGYASAEGAGGN